MRVLVTNDDGLTSPWLPPLVEALSDRAEVRVWAPSSDRSATSKSSVFGPVLIKETPRGVAVEGYPADAVQTALSLDGPFDYVLAGVNSEPNLGAAVALTSGTIGAALEAALAGVPAAAVSAHPETSKEEAAEIAAKWAGAGGVWNLNIPPLPKGMKVCRLRPPDPNLRVRELRGKAAEISRSYLDWKSGRDGRDGGAEHGDDAAYFAAGYITATPLLTDITDYRALPQPRVGSRYNNT